MYYFISNDDYYYSTNGGVNFVKKTAANLSFAGRFKSKATAQVALDAIIASSMKPKNRTAKAIANCGADPNSFKIEEWPSGALEVGAAVKVGDVLVTASKKPNDSLSAADFRDNLIQEVIDRVSFTDLEQQDILHTIENGHIDAVKISKLAKRLKEVREERRILKNMYSALCSSSNKEDIEYGLRTHIVDDILGIITKETN